MAGVAIGPGLRALTRILRALRSTVHVRANERTAAFVALYTLKFSNPFVATIDALRMIDAPSGTSGSAFCTVKSTPFTLMLKIES
jgi:2-succinyl-5-enolpyruvyl-6-hydroxy-3-cyclohexene-1-carboxylate synthase